jgi:dienelactone hydrolase
MTDPMPSRRAFLHALGLGALALHADPAGALTPSASAPNRKVDAVRQLVLDGDGTMLGAYGDWAAGLTPDPPHLSLRRGGWPRLDDWRTEARARLLMRIAPPEVAEPPVAEAVGEHVADGVRIESLQWAMPYGPPVEGVLLTPIDLDGPFPGVLALHDHGGDKWHGWRKVASDGGPVPPMIQRHWDWLYSGRPWANELARRGYAVLAFDGFAFGSRRVRLADVPERIRGDLPPTPPQTEDEIRAYNRWASPYESTFAKSLFSAGTTWPGVTLADDRAALDVLAAHPAIDANRLACAGLSGGGLRTVYLGGADPRVKAAVCVSMMTTWRDFALHKSHTHTWMVYPPILPTELDYPEVLGLRAPLPTLVQMNRQDRLFTFEETARADAILRDVYALAAAPEAYTGAIYEGDHAFPEPLQEDAFDWLDQWL